MNRLEEIKMDKEELKKAIQKWTSGRQEFVMSDLINECLEINPSASTRSLETKIGPILREFGFRKYQIGKHRVRAWRREARIKIHKSTAPVCPLCGKVFKGEDKGNPISVLGKRTENGATLWEVDGFVSCKNCPRVYISKISQLEAMLKISGLEGISEQIQTEIRNLLSQTEKQEIEYWGK